MKYLYKFTHNLDHISSDEALVCSVESNVDSWVMDSSASFHATHCIETVKNLMFDDLEGQDLRTMKFLMLRAWVTLI